MDAISSQTKIILKMLLEGKAITPKSAMEDIGCMRLGARIFDIRQLGYDIETETCETVSRYGHKVRFARYRLKQKETA